MAVVVAGVTGGMGAIIVADILRRGTLQDVPLRLVVLLDFFGATAAAQTESRTKLLTQAQALLNKAAGKKKPPRCTLMALHWDASALSSTEEVCKTVASLVGGGGGPLLGLLVTTGIGFHGDVATMELKESAAVLARQLAVNCVGPSLLCQEMAKLMVPAPKQQPATSANPGPASAPPPKKSSPPLPVYCPTILVLSSFSGLIGLPYRSHYCASKFALNGFLEGLHAAHPETLRLVLVCPTSVSTPFRENWKKDTAVAAVAAGAAEVVNKADLTPEQCVAGVLAAWHASRPKAGLEYVVMPGGKTGLAAWAVKAPLVSSAVRQAVLRRSKI